MTLEQIAKWAKKRAAENKKRANQECCPECKSPYCEHSEQEQEVIKAKLLAKAEVYELVALKVIE